MSDLPCHQFPYAKLIPLSGHYLDARNELVRDHFDFTHPTHPRKRFSQPLGIDPGRYRQRQTRERVDLAADGPHPGRRHEPQQYQCSACDEYPGSAIVAREPAAEPSAEEYAERLGGVVDADGHSPAVGRSEARDERRQHGFEHVKCNEAMLPSLVSRLAPTHGRGVATGVHNTT